MVKLELIKSFILRSNRLMKTKVFIDGSEGTTGLRIHERFSKRDDIEILAISPELRKDPDERRRLINASDITFLCLPDAAAIEAVEMLFKTGISEETAEGIIDKYFCREFLDHYKDIVLEETRLVQIGFYYNHRKKFIRRQRVLGKKIILKTG